MATELLIIRNATLDDAPALEPLLDELGFPAPAHIIEKRLDAMLRMGELVLVASRFGQLLGLLTVHITPVLHRPTPVGRLTALVVAKEAQRQGVGRSLVKTAEQMLAERGCGLVEVTSHQRLAEAHDFYKRLGYDVTSLRFKKSLELAAPDTF